NNDGVVNVLDVVLEVNVILGKETRPEIVSRADLNGDGAIDMQDLDIVVNIALNFADRPIANTQAISAPAGTPVSVLLTADDPRGLALTFCITSGPSHGSLAGSLPNLTYTPAADFSGADSVTFVASDGLLT